MLSRSSFFAPRGRTYTISGFAYWNSRPHSQGASPPPSSTISISLGVPGGLPFLVVRVTRRSRQSRFISRSGVAVSSPRVIETPDRLTALLALPAPRRTAQRSMPIFHVAIA